jgi:pimeloyl-ACP methyl ester carboxylesterase
VTLHTLADDVAGVIQALQLQSVNILGHAFGNRVARMMAADHPELARSVILFALNVSKFGPRLAGAVVSSILARMRRRSCSVAR